MENVVFEKAKRASRRQPFVHRSNAKQKRQPVQRP